VTFDRPPDRRTVLVVDDDAATRQAYSRALGQTGFRTLEAANGLDALALLTSQPIDAMVLDQQMPAMTGMDLIAKIRTLPSHNRTPVLFVAGDGSPEKRIRALQAGATDFMVKPVVLAELVARVGAQIRLRATWSASVRELSRRAETVAALAELVTEGLNTASTATVLCGRISDAQDGAPVGLYESSFDGTQLLLASVGKRASFIDVGSDPSLLTLLRRQVRGVPWLEHEPAAPGLGDAGIWWACAPLRHGGRSLGVLTLGGSAVRRDSVVVDQLLAAAVDYAAIAAMHLGPGLSHARSAHESREAVRRVLTDRAFWPVFQPIVRLGDGGIIGYEALTRFRDGVPPDRCLADAAEVGLAAEMELALLSTAIESSEGLSGDVWLSVNVSAEVLIEHNVDLVALMAEATHPLVIELTEHTPIDDYEVARAALARLGPTVRLSVDDAGAGFASLRHVVDLHPHFLKLDRSWVARINYDHARQALVAGLVGFAAQTGTDIIAEGIETSEEKDVLKQIGVVYGQGYLLGRPEPLITHDEHADSQ
jgi:EAL domain-containing protein (putative c-di-GMP-specific phosphodiesterase class I)/DNA-binding response OmpR family regulator